MATAKEYFEGNEHGNYQYTTLEEIVTNFQVMATDTDSFIKNTPDYLFRYYGRQAVKQISRSVSKEVKAFEIEIGQDLLCTLPQDYVDYVRISCIEGKKTIPLRVNNNIITAKAYLKESKFSFDASGNATGDILCV